MIDSLNDTHRNKRFFFNDEKDEIVQVYLRFSLLVIGTVSFALFYIYTDYLLEAELDVIYTVILLYGFYNFSYYLWIRRFPNRFVFRRILFIMTTDIIGTVYVMYLLGELSTLFAAVLLWYIVGYGMRYGPKFAILSLVITTISWLMLYSYSPYWHEHPMIFFGWQLAFFIVPAYYLFLVKRLHLALEELESAYTDTRQLAHYDHLTGLPNRYHFQERFKTMLCTQASNQQFALLLIDLDGFKDVNDTYGHNIGDEVLQEVSGRLQESCKNECFVARLGGDEFILTVNDAKIDDIQSMCTSIIEQLSQPYSNNINSITASIGVSLYPHDSNDDFLIKKYADIAMYHAKQQGKNQYIFYSDIFSKSDVSLQASS